MNTTDTDEKKLPTEKSPAGGESRKAGEPSGTSTANNGAKPRSKSPSIETVGQLLRSVYGGKFKRSTLKKTELIAMRSGPLPTEAEREELLGLAQSDLVLDKTRQLMLLALRIDGPVAGKVRDFARDVLQQHPLFKAETLAGVLRNLPESPTEEGAIAALLAQELGSVPWPKQSTAMTTRQHSQCKSNAVHCLLMVFRATRGTSLNRILSYLNSGLWAPSARRHKGEEAKLAVMIGTRDPGAASITFGLLELEAIEQRHRAKTALRSEERAVARVADLERQIADLERRLEGAEAAAQAAGEELVAAKESHATAKAHWKDDYEQLRGQMRRRMKEELVLLDEGLHALRRAPPKVHVMIDHAERAIDGLKREMDRLRGGE